MSTRPADGYLSRYATTEARGELVEWLREQAEEEAKGSRDFGRGFTHAIRVLMQAPVMCQCCNYPRRPGETVACPLCGALWRVYPLGASWVPGGTPLPMKEES